MNIFSEKKLISNLLSDYILFNIPRDSNTIIQVADCDNFFIVKGETDFDELLDLNQIKNEFQDFFSDKINREKIYTIDLIKYNSKIKPKEEYDFVFYNSLNPSYKKEIPDEDDLITVSSFPYGYSLPMGRLLYYYFKHIVYNIPPNYPFLEIKFKLDLKNNKEISDSFQVFLDGSEDQDTTLSSAIKDVFDFNLEKLENDFSDVNLFDNIFDLEKDFEFLKKRNKDFIIL